MQLFHQCYGEQGEPVILLHGLFGNQANWAWQAKALARDFRVYGFDLRNHGQSPWRDQHTYPALAGDILETMDALGLESAALVGHSMGGKAAMQAAFMAPERVSRLLVEDIAPVDYPGDSFAPLDGMLAVDTGTLTSRREADEILAGYVTEKPVRDFLLTNLVRRPEGGFAWRCNLPVLADCYDAIKGGLDPEGIYKGETLFVKGARSDYLLEEHGEAIMRQFPQARFRIIANAGHWIHSEKPEAFLKAAREFLGASE